jgi:hypothetical protein
MLSTLQSMPREALELVGIVVVFTTFARVPLPLRRATAAIQSREAGIECDESKVSMYKERGKATWYNPQKCEPVQLETPGVTGTSEYLA